MKGHTGTIRENARTPGCVPAIWIILDGEAAVEIISDSKIYHPCAEDGNFLRS